MIRPTCPICGSRACLAASVLFGQKLHNGEQYFCRECGHGFRLEPPDYAYITEAMCAVSTDDDRLHSQIAYFAPFVPPLSRILEIGCATGRLAMLTRQQLKPARYDAIELSRETGAKALPYLDQLYDVPLLGLTRTEQISGPYDLVIISHVLEHVEDPLAEMVAIKSLLGPRGAVFAEVPNGSGHPKFPADDNPAHQHFFSPDSLSRLISLSGLHTIAFTTGIYMDARYANAMRVVARRGSVHVWRGTFLSEHPALKAASDIVVWGAPSLVEDVLANYFDISKIDFFIDIDAAKQGIPRLGKEVRGPEALGNAPRTVFINSLYWEENIRTQIADMYPGVPHRIVCMREVLQAGPDPG